MAIISAIISITVVLVEGTLETTQDSSNFPYPIAKSTGILGFFEDPMLMIKLLLSFSRLTVCIMFITSDVLPEFEKTIKVSSGPILPISPCADSAGLTKNEGIPMLAMVALILCPIIPAFPIPAVITLPFLFSDRSIITSIALNISSVIFRSLTDSV